MKKKYLSLLLCGAFAVSAQAAGESAGSKTDVLGRHVSSVRNTPKAYVKDVKKQGGQKSDLVKSKALMKRWDEDENKKAFKTWASFEYRPDKNGTMKRTYTLNGESRTEYEYRDLMEAIEESDLVRNTFMRLYAWTEYPDNVYPESRYYYASGDEPNTCRGQDSCSLRLKTDPLYDSHGNPVMETIDFRSIASVTNSSNLPQYTYNSNIMGKNIGISFVEDGLPESRIFPNGRLRMVADCEDQINKDGALNATRVARLLYHVAPKATLYGYSSNCVDYSHYGDFVFPIGGFGQTPKIYIGNIKGGKYGSVYSKQNMALDQIIYYTRVIEFVGVGENGLHDGAFARINDLAKSVNAISVGAVRNNLEYHKTSSRTNPKYSESGASYVKPEIANFSDFLFPDETSLIFWGNSKLHSYFMQTASASAYTAATVALLLQKFPFYKWHPEVVKALLLTSSVKTISNAAQHDPDNDGKYAMGVVDGQTMFTNNRSRFWNGRNDDYFQNGDIEFTESDIKVGKKYRIAISWLNSGEFIDEVGYLPQDLDLHVYQNGHFVASSTSWDNPFEMVEFTATESADLNIRINRYKNYGGRVLLGYNLVEVN